jgi:hypothetical protein
MQFCSPVPDFSLGLAEWLLEMTVVENVCAKPGKTVVSLGDVSEWAKSAGFGDWLKASSAMTKRVDLSVASPTIARIGHPDFIARCVNAAPKFLEELQLLANARFKSSCGDEFTSVSWAVLRGNVRELRHALSMGGSPDSTVLLRDDTRPRTAERTAVAIALLPESTPRTLVGRAACLTLLIQAGARLFEGSYNGGVVDPVLDLRGDYVSCV